MRASCLQVSSLPTGRSRDGTGWKPVLRNNREREIVSVATFVVSLEGVAANRNRSAISKVAERSGNRRRSSVENHLEDPSDVENPCALHAQSKLCPVTDCHPGSTD